MKKLVLTVIFIISFFLSSVTNLKSVLGFAGPGFYFENIEGGGETGLEDLKLIGTGYLNEIYHGTLSGDFGAPYDSSTNPHPIYLELYISISNVEGNLVRFEDVEQFYGKIVDEESTLFEDRFFPVIYVDSAYDVDWENENLVFTYFDLVYYTYENDTNFLSTEITNANDVTDLYNIYEFLGKVTVYNGENMIGLLSMFQKIHQNTCSLIFTEVNPFDYGFGDGFYLVNVNTSCDNLNLVIPNIENSSSVSSEYYNNWADSFLEDLILIDLK